MKKMKLKMKLIFQILLIYKQYQKMNNGQRNQLILTKKNKKYTNKI